MSKKTNVWRYLLALLFIASGLNHFLHPLTYLVAMPSYLPAPELLIYLSGAIALLLGILLLIPAYAHIAAWGMIAWLIAVFPANVHMVANAYLYPEFVRMLLWLRLLLQFPLILWAYRYTCRNDNAGKA